MLVARVQVSGVSANVVYRKTIPSGIIGAQIEIVYAEEIWKGLRKTVVFRGAVTKDVITDDDVVTIPAEVVSKPNVVLYVGVYGVDSDGKLAIPTLWANLGAILDAADPSGDTSTDQSLPVWAALQAMIGNLDDLDTTAKENLVAAVNEALTKGGGAVDEAEIQRIVNDYLAANPPTVTETDPTVPAWAKQPQKPAYTAAEVGALSAETLPAAINTALAQAKDSGEFDGKDGNPGTPGEDGYSPTASVTQTDTGAFITITDKAGTTTATLKNGADGQPGPQGATPNIRIGTVETLEAGSPATASMDGTPENPILNLGIPQGAPGTGGGGGIAVTGATVGQTVKIAAVDDDGVPTAWEPVDFPSGGGDETSYAGELLSSGTISYETAYATVTIPVTWEKLRSYKIFVLTLSYDTNANAQFLDFEDKYGYNGIKTATIVFEWIDSAHTRARTYAYNYVSSVINKLNFAVQLFRSANIVPEIPKFIANDTDYFSFNLSTAQTTGIVYNIYGGFK